MVKYHQVADEYAMHTDSIEETLLRLTAIAKTSADIDALKG